MAVLYRKYRSQTFSEVIGQKSIIRTLTNQVQSGMVSHAYLFTGSRGVGKTSVARILAKAVNCVSQKPSLSRPRAGHLPQKGEKNIVQASPDALGDACGKCEVCKQIEAGVFLDLVEIDAASNTGVDNIRELIEHVKFSPSTGKYKVFIIDEVHMLSKGAFNALLKTLEEPPKHAIFILATTEINKVPATIISRTQRFDFKRLTADEIKEHLKFIIKSEKFKLDDAVLELVAGNSEGSVRDSLSLLDKVMTLGQGTTLEDCRQLLGITDLAHSERLLRFILDGNVQELPDFFNSLREQGVDLSVFNRDFLEYLRKVLVYSAAGEKNFSGFVEQNFTILTDLAGRSGGLNSLIFIIRLFLKSFKDISESPDPFIPLLVASLEGAGRKSSQSLNQKTHPQPTVSSIIKEDAEAIAEIIPQKVFKKIEVTKASDEAQAFEQASFEEILEVWPKVIAKVKNLNTPLANLIRGCEFKSVEEGWVVLGVKFLFHQQSLQQHKNRQLICEVLKEVSGKNLGLRVYVIKPEDKPIQNPVAALGDALKIFGGELVE